MSEKIMEILADVTGGKSYKAHKYGLDHAERPFIDYGEDSIVWQKTAETDHIRHYVDLAKKSKQVAEIGDQLLTYFLDGSRRVFKVDDIAYQQSGRSVIYPVIAGQIGVGCCKRVDKRLKPEKFVKEIVLVVPDKADADGKPGFFQATAKKLNESPELKRLNLEFSTVLDYKTMRGKRVRYIDFNQGVDARLVTDETMKKLSEINIRPLRIAFDHYEQKEIYVRAIRTAAKHGIKDLSNYLLYNFMDKPDDLYYRMKINVDLCEELGVTIYSFPMKYHPIDDPIFFRNRDYIGKHWNRKFIRAVQAVLNATKGKIGKGKDFFEEAFGSNINEFYDILWMLETFIIYRMKYKDNLTAEWREKFNSLSPKQEEMAKRIIKKMIFQMKLYLKRKVIRCWMYWNTTEWQESR